jgi:hypothetical protein
MIKQFISLLMALLVLANSASAQDKSPEYCWKQTRTRGVGTIPTDCSYDQQRQGLLCYPKCRAGFTGVASVCWQDCPSGYFDDGAFCRKTGSYGRGVGFGWQAQDGISDAGMLARCRASTGGACEMSGPIAYPTCKAGYYAVGANICAQGCPAGMTDMGVSCTKQSFMRATIGGQCPSGKTYQDGLCYDSCPSGYYGIGPICAQKCPANLPYTCGAGCAKNIDACASVTNEQVANVLSVVTDVVLAIVTVGTSYGVKVAAKNVAQTAAEQGIKAAAKAALKEIGENFSKNMTKEIFKAKVKEVASGLAEDTVDNLYETLSIQGTQAFIAQLDGEAPAEFDFYSLDPTGIASVVKAYNHGTCDAPPPTAAEIFSNQIPAAGIPYVEQRPWTLAGGQFGVLDLAAGGDGTLWAVTDQQILRLKPGQANFQTISKSGLPASPLASVAAFHGDTAFVVTGNPGQAGSIYRYDRGNWTKLPGMAFDIAVDSIGSLYAIGHNDSLWKLPAGEEVWAALPALPGGSGQPLRIGAGGVEQVWVVTNDNKDFRWVGANATQPTASPWISGGTNQSVSDVAVGSDGSAWFASGSGNIVVNRAGVRTQLPQVAVGASPTRIAMAGTGRVFALATRQIYKFSGNK